MVLSPARALLPSLLAGLARPSGSPRAEAQRTPPLSPLSPQRTPTPTLARPLADKPGPLHSLPARLPAGPRASVAPSRARERVVRVPYIPLTR